MMFLSFAKAAITPANLGKTLPSHLNDSDRRLQARSLVRLGLDFSRHSGIFLLVFTARGEMDRNSEHRRSSCVGRAPLAHTPTGLVNKGTLKSDGLDFVTVGGVSDTTWLNRLLLR
jgi:hypothetical protein